jgi:Putative transposase DNA-binding domain
MAPGSRPERLASPIQGQDGDRRPGRRPAQRLGREDRRRLRPLLRRDPRRALTITGLTRSAGGTIAKPGRGVRAKAALAPGIMATGWRALLTRLEHKAPIRVEKVNPTYTSQTGNACHHLARESRKNQEDLQCAASAHQVNADVNAATNIAERAAAAGLAVAARRDRARLARSVKPEPQLVASQAAVGILAIHGPGGCQRRNNAERAARSSSGAGATPRTSVTRTPMVTAMVVRMDGETARTVSPAGSEKYMSTMTLT